MLTIQAENVRDAASKLDLGYAPADIRITWRRGDIMTSDYGRNPEPGCIVDATSVPGEEVKRCFKTAAEAARYIAKMLKKHDDAVKKIRAEHVTRERNAKRLAASQRKQEPFTQSGSSPWRTA